MQLSGEAINGAVNGKGSEVLESVFNNKIMNKIDY